MIPFVLEVVDGELDRSLYFGEDRVSPPSVWNGHPLTCQTCDGKGEYMMATDYDGLRRFDPMVDACPDCVDGHPIIDVDCPHCMKCYDDDCPTCDECCEFGSVRVSVQAVPIEHNAASPRTQPHVAVSTVYEPNGEAFLWVDAHKQVVEVDIGPEPLSQVGRFAIIATPEGDDQ